MYRYALAIQLMFFSFSSLAQLIATSDPYTYFLKIDPRGSYMITDTQHGDLKISASNINLSPFYLSPVIQLHEGDVIKIQKVGAFVNEGSSDFDVSQGLVAVFKNQAGGFLAPGNELQLTSFQSAPTCWNGNSTPLEEQLPRNNKKIF